MGPKKLDMETNGTEKVGHGISRFHIMVCLNEMTWQEFLDKYVGFLLFLSRRVVRVTGSWISAFQIHGIPRFRFLDFHMSRFLDVQIERFLHFRANGMGGLRIFASKSNVFLRIPRCLLVGRQGESLFFELSRPRRLRAKFEQIATHAARQTEWNTYLKRVLEKLPLQG